MFRPSFLLIGIALGLLVGCEPSLKPSVPRRDVLAIVIDASSSARLAEGQTIADLRCQEAVAVVEQALHEPGLRQLDVLVLATGGTGTSNEGRVIIPWRSFASTSRLFGKNRSRATQQREFLQSLEAACRTALKSENTSPIFFAIERAATSLAEQTHQRSPGDDATVSGGVRNRAERTGCLKNISIKKYLLNSDSSAFMPPRRAITDECRVIDLTVGELMDVFFERLSKALPFSGTSTAEPEALLDTWQVASLLGVTPKHDPGSEPPKGTPEWRTWRVKHQAVRDDVAHRFQQLLSRRPELAKLARYDGRRRYFVRADVVRYLDELGKPARSRHR